jgi:glycosyltransferase involved in cell wall biosynthesis
MGSTKRLFSITTSFQKLGFKVILLAQNYENHVLQSEVEHCYSGIILRTELHGSYPKFINKFRITRKAIRGFWHLLGNESFLFNLSIGWSKKLNIKKIMENEVFNDCDIKFIWGMSGGLLDGASAASLLAKHLRVPWFFELHDPPIGVDIHSEFKSLVREFTHLLEDCDLVVPNTKTYRDLLIKKHNVPEDKCFPIFMTYDDSMILSNSNVSYSDKFVLTYVGSLSGQRTLVNFMHGLNLAINTNKNLKNNFKLILAGIGNGFDEVLILAKKYDLSSNVDYRGQINSKEVDSLIYGSYATIIVQARANNLEIPGKLFQTLSYDKTILGLMDPDSETASILVESGLGIVAPDESINIIADSILKIYDNYCSNTPTTPNVNFIGNFKESNLNEILNSALLKVCFK